MPGPTSGEKGSSTKLGVTAYRAVTAAACACPIRHAASRRGTAWGEASRCTKSCVREAFMDHSFKRLRSCHLKAQAPGRLDKHQAPATAGFRVPVVRTRRA